MMKGVFQGLLRCQKGFVLPMTLWMLAAMIVAAGYLATWSERSVEQAGDRIAGIDAEVELRSTTATLLYLLATRPYNYGGLMTELDGDRVTSGNPLAGSSLAPSGKEISLAGKPYSGLGLSGFSLQDTGGLVGLNALKGKRLERLLEILGVPPKEGQILVARLQDYTDSDELHRLNGAEALDYVKLRRLPPPNRPLKTSWEIWNVLGWGERGYLLKEGGLSRLTTALYGESINLNTSPTEVLQTLEGVDRETAKRLVAARPLKSLTEASLAIGRPLPLKQIETATLASDILRMVLWHPDLPRQREILLKLTPFAKGGRPWMIEYELDISQPIPKQELEEAPGSLFSDSKLAAN